MSKMVKTAKVDLSAIHRLEFYKKQAHWKFCPVKPKIGVKSAEEINATYVLDHPEIQTEPNEVISDIKEESLESTLVLEELPIDVCCSENETEAENNTQPPKRRKLSETPETSNKWFRSILYWGRPEGPKLLNREIDYTNCINTQSYNSDFYEKWLKYEQECKEIWNIDHSKIWNEYRPFQEVADDSFSSVGSSDKNMIEDLKYLQICAESYAPVNYLDMTVQWPEFTRGASRAPHSSEYNLSITLNKGAESKQNHQSDAHRKDAKNSGQNEQVRKSPQTGNFGRNRTVVYKECNDRSDRNNTNNGPNDKNYTTDIPKTGKQSDSSGSKAMDIRHRSIFSTSYSGDCKDVILAGSFKNKPLDDIGNTYLESSSADSSVGRGRGRLYKRNNSTTRCRLFVVKDVVLEGRKVYFYKN